MLLNKRHGPIQWPHVDEAGYAAARFQITTSLCRDIIGSRDNVITRYYYRSRDVTVIRLRANLC